MRLAEHGARALGGGEHVTSRFAASECKVARAVALVERMRELDVL